MNNLMIADPTWLAIFLFGIGGIVSGIMMTGRDLNPIDRVMVSISSIQKWCGLGILLAAVFVLLGSPLAAKSLQAVGGELWASKADEARAVQMDLQLAQADYQLAEAEWDVKALEATLNGQTALAAAYAGIADGYGQLVTQLTLAMTDVELAATEIEALGNQAGILPEGIVLFNPLASFTGTMFGLFAILILVMARVTDKYGDQKPMSTMILILFPILVALSVFIWKLKSGSTNSDTEGMLVHFFILLMIACITLPFTWMGLRGLWWSRASEMAGICFVILGIFSVYMGIRYMWVLGVEPLVHLV